MPVEKFRDRKTWKTCIEKRTKEIIRLRDELLRSKKDPEDVVHHEMLQLLDHTDFN